MSPPGHLLFDLKKSLVLFLALIVVVQIGAHKVSKREILEDVLQLGPKMSLREAKESVNPRSWWDPNDDVEEFAGLKRSSKKVAAYLRYDSDEPEADRYAPKKDDTNPYYVLTEDRLKKIRSQLMYWYFDKGGDDDWGDYQKDVHNSITQLHKNLNFRLPFYGNLFNYTRVSLNGYLEFSDPPQIYTYPLEFPVKDWPKENDPSFIGIFYTKARIGKIKPEDINKKKPGVYFRAERDLQSRNDQFGREMYKRLMLDIREGMVGAETFDPKHAVIVTWKNISFAGGPGNTLMKTNTFQMVVATDEVYTYVIFNYLDMQWMSHTEAGGTDQGNGGIPAFVGFNAGNGTQSYEYKPYSQRETIQQLLERGWVNGLPGRHIFRVDEKIMLGNCNKDIAGANLELVFAPESGNMLGGTVVSITGHCFDPKDKIECQFDTVSVTGRVVNVNRAVCIQPYVKAEGFIRFAVKVNSRKYDWKGKYYIETPATATQYIYFEDQSVHKHNPDEINFEWDPRNLTRSLDVIAEGTSEKYNNNTILNKDIQISLWGYRETTNVPELLHITDLQTDIKNSGFYKIVPSNYRTRRNPFLQDLYFGFIQINLTRPEEYGLKITPQIWSKPIPLGWYFRPQWEELYGSFWTEELCNKWTMNDRYLKNFASEVALCPCKLEQALTDKGRFLPDFDCDKDSNPSCMYNTGAIHCVKTGAPNLDGSEQQCCYDKDHYLMLTYDKQWGSRPHRSHNLGFLPWDEPNKVPTLSHWFHDMVPLYMCCLWQEEQSVGCETYRFERRPSQDCIGYQSPAVGSVFGDPHIVNFDGDEYTFNGKGEFVLAKVNDNKYKLDIQARFEQLPDNVYGETRGTKLTAVAARNNDSATIEVRLRPSDAQWRYRLDVFANKKRVYFDRPSLKFQHYKGVLVYTPTYILNQSEVVIMFDTGVGVEVIENKGYLAARVYLPWTYMNKTRGLMGNWSYDLSDDFVLANGSMPDIPIMMNDFEIFHKRFGMAWMVDDHEDKDLGHSLFVREHGRSASSYNDRNFKPEYRKFMTDIIPSNRSQDLEKAKEICGEVYQCQYDYAVSLNRDMAEFTKNYYDSVTKIKEVNSRKIISCGILETPRFGRKNNYRFDPGTQVTFECHQGFVLIGDQRRTCLPEGRWNVPEYGYTECLRQIEYSQRQAWTAVGVLTGLLIPAIIIVAILVTCFKKKRKDEDASKSWRFSERGSGLDDKDSSMKPSPFVRAFGSSRSAVKNVAQVSPSRIRRSYEGVYLTHEPLPNRPNVEFEDKDWDLKRDYSSSSPSELARNLDSPSKESDV